MTDGSTGAGGRPTAYGNTSSSSNVPRRLSYASVASGTNISNTTNTTRSGIYAHLATTTASSSNPFNSTPEVRHSRSLSEEQDVSGINHKRQQPQLPLYSRKYAGLPGFSSKPGNSFFVPSYLKESRYITKLEALHARKLRNERETRLGHHSTTSSGAQSSSNVNVHRIAPSHRGMTYEVIESNPPKDDEDRLLPLPTRWNEQDKYPGLDVFNDGLDVRYNGSTSKSDVEAASVRADYPMSPACGIYYYEVEIKSKTKECAVAIGFSTAKASLERLPGWEPDSWAYHGDDGKTFSGEHNGRPYSHTFTTGDVIGCGINFNTGHAFFTKNGLDLGTAFRELKDKKPFPCIGIKKYSGAVISVNFGQRPFVYDIDERVARERNTVVGQIRKTKTSTLHPKLDDAAIVQELVSQFLLHGGYVETSRGFEEEIKREKRALNNSSTTVTPQMSDIDASNAANRQQIRRAILAGDIDAAFDITNNHYAGVLQNSPGIVFHMKCRKWIELISKAADLRSRQQIAHENRRARRTSNGFAKPSVAAGATGDSFDQHMELDEEQQAAINGNGKLPASDNVSNAGNDIAYNQILAQAMDYGQILRREYNDEKDSGYNEKLQDIFSLIVYDDPRDSPHGDLLDLGGRVKVAEELNSAILVSMGRPPTAALENALKQTETFLDILGIDGGPASFVNLQTEFERR